MPERGIQARLSAIVAFMLLSCASSAAQPTNIKLNYDRIQFAESFLSEVYPELKPRGLITVQTFFGYVGADFFYVGLTLCRPGSGVPGGTPRIAFNPPGCPGPMQADASSYLMAQVELVPANPHLHGFGAAGRYVNEKLETWHQEIVKHPDWEEKDMLQALSNMNPQFGPGHKDMFMRVVPTQVIERFSGCRLSPASATFSAKRLSKPPDTDMQLGWTVSGTSRERGRRNCSATFEPFEGKLLTISR
jgi:hypothetical protein